MFQNIKSLRPYFFSLREIEGNVSLDVRIPLTWKFDTIIAPYRSIKTKVQDKSEKFTLISLISNATQDGYDVVFACASEIVNVNKEDEEKRKLFQAKVKELENSEKTSKKKCECWKGYKRAGTQKGTGKNAGKRVNKCVKA